MGDPALAITIFRRRALPSSGLLDAWRDTVTRVAPICRWPGLREKLGRWVSGQHFQVHHGETLPQGAMGALGEQWPPATGKPNNARA